MCHWRGTSGRGRHTYKGRNAAFSERATISYMSTDNYITTDSIDVHIRTAGYENIYFDCPTCGIENILNRVSDLKNIMPISRKEGIVCQNPKCGQVMAILGDTATSPKYKWFLNELDILSLRKEYRSHILSLCQCMEAFFLDAVINKKFDRNRFYRDKDGHVDFERYMRDRKKFEKRIKRHEFNKMRQLFLRTFANERANYLPHHPTLKEDKRNEYFSLVENTSVNKIRNQVVHKSAYRPKREEVEQYDELITAITWLGLYLDVEDSVMLLNSRLL